MRKGRWKLHFAKYEGLLSELYDLDADIGETQNVIHAHPEVVRELEVEADKAREDLGDDLNKIEGRGRRPVGLVDNPQPLAFYDENHPYIVACYDRSDRCRELV